MGWPQGNTCAKSARQNFSGRVPLEDLLEVIAGLQFIAGDNAAGGPKKRPSGCPEIARDHRTVIGAVDDLPVRVEDLPRRPGQEAWRSLRVSDAVELRRRRLL